MQQLGRVQRRAAGEMLDLQAAGEARRDHRPCRDRPGARRETAAARRPGATPRNAPSRSRTSRPCRSSRRPGRSPRPRGCAAAAAASAPCRPASAGGSGPGRGSLRAGRNGRSGCGLRLRRSPPRNSSKVRQAAATTSALLPLSPLEQGGIIVLDGEDAARLAGDDGFPAAAQGYSRSTLCAGVRDGLGRACRWRSSAGRSNADRRHGIHPARQRLFLSKCIAPQPGAGDSSMAARPISGS